MQIFYKFFKSLWWVHLCWMFPPNRNFGNAIAVQDLRGIHLWNFFNVPPRTKILAPSLYAVYSVYLSVVTCAPPPPICIRGGPHAYMHTYSVSVHSYRSKFTVTNNLSFLFKYPYLNIQNVTQKMILIDTQAEEFYCNWKLLWDLLGACIFHRLGDRWIDPRLLLAFQAVNRLVKLQLDNNSTQVSQSDLLTYS